MANILKKAYSDILNPLDYRTKGNRFYKISGDFLYAVSYLKINKYVVRRWYSIYPLFWEIDTKSISDSECNFFENWETAKLLKRTYGIQYQEPYDADELFDFIQNELTLHVLPYFEKIHSPQTYLLNLIPQPVITSIINRDDLMLAFCSEDEFHRLRDLHIAKQKSNSNQIFVSYEKQWDLLENRYNQRDLNATRAYMNEKIKHNTALLGKLGYYF